MTNNIPCKVDALSLTWSPKELLRIKDLAKIGACIKGEIITNSKNAALTRHLQTLKTKKDSDLLNVAAFDANGYKDVLNRYQTACTVHM
jgi:hypothetical protein